MKADSTPCQDWPFETDIDSERLELAEAIYDLFRFGFIAEEVDAEGIARFSPTGKQP